MNEQNNKTIENDSFVPRPPVVVVMGHIDHGKSKLLDYIRHANIVEKEAGGITQHIGAYEAEVKCEDASHEHKTRKITFLDTPGHEAFSQMRLRGAKVADVAILIIAADEGIKPQTMEAYEAIKKADIPFLIALNKIDKPNADPERIKAQLAEKQIFVENYGGTIPTANISAKTGEGVDGLLDIVLLLSEMENLKANPEENASGVVIESKLGAKRGISATLLIQNGKMKKGMFVVSGKAMAPIRIFENFQGKNLDEATFSSPVKIVGFDNIPEAGNTFKTFCTKKEAEENARETLALQPEIAETGTANAENIDGKIILPIIIKADVSGSIEALENEITKLNSEDTVINILKKGVGKINENDARLASSADGSAILGFNVGVEPAAKEISEKFGVKIFSSDIIYKISEWLEERVNERKTETPEEKILGTAKILKLFSKTKNKQLAGGQVISGKITVGKKFALKRNEETIGEGKIIGVQRAKAKASEVAEGDEFGAMLECKIELAPKDEIVISVK